MTRALLIASALVCLNMLTGHSVSASRIERPHAYSAWPLRPAIRAIVTCWPMPSSGGKDQSSTALSHLLMRHYDQVVEAFARMCEHWAFPLAMRALAPQGAVSYAELAAAPA